MSFVKRAAPPLDLGRSNLPPLAVVHRPMKPRLESEPIGPKTDDEDESRIQSKKRALSKRPGSPIRVDDSIEIKEDNPVLVEVVARLKAHLVPIIKEEIRATLERDVEYMKSVRGDIRAKIEQDEGDVMRAKIRAMIEKEERTIRLGQKVTLSESDKGVLVDLLALDKPL